MLKNAIQILKGGGLVAMPTETVYGLAADARNQNALQKIFQVKNRPADHPLIVHIAEISQLTDWAIEVSEQAYRLAEAFWPGPLTLILKRAPNVLSIVTGGQTTIGLRIPAHPIAQALLREFGNGLAAPSANRFGRISPTNAQAVYEELGDAVDLILEGGSSEVGLESTIIDVSCDNPVLLRPGMISSAAIEAVLNKTVIAPQASSPRVSGSMESHYAPATKTYLVSTADMFTFLQNNTVPIALLTRCITQSSDPNILLIHMPQTAKAYAHDLYQTLRAVDRGDFKKIVIEKVPEDSEWDAICDRLQRACSR